MTAIIICTHSSFAQGLLSACEMMLGELENVSAIPFEEGDDAAALRERIRDEAERMNCEKTLVLTDLFGASPANAASALLFERDGAVMSGVNLAMAVQAAALRDTGDFKEYITQLEQEAKLSIRTVTPDMLKGEDE